MHRLEHSALAATDLLASVFVMRCHLRAHASDTFVASAAPAKPRASSTQVRSCSSPCRRRDSQPSWRAVSTAHAQAQRGHDVEGEGRTPLLLYPCASALSVADVRERMRAGRDYFLIAIDGTWTEAKEILFSHSSINAEKDMVLPNASR